MVVESLEVVVSLVVLAVAGDQFVIGASRVAAALRVRPIVVGAVIGGLGASLPALLVSGVASVRGDYQIAVGNLVGSIIANISLGLAIAAVIAPVRVDSRTVRREAPVSAAAVLLFAVMVPGGLGTVKGVGLFVGLLLGLGTMLLNARRAARPDELAQEVTDFFEGSRHRPRPELVRAVVGLTLMVAGSELLVRSASALAGRLGVGQEFIGLTVVAVGTSAPVVAIAIQAARRHDPDLVVGNVLGSNLFVALAGGSLVGFLHHGAAPGSAAGPVWMMAGIVLASWGFMARRSLVTRWEAGVLIAAYAATLLLAPR